MAPQTAIGLLALAVIIFCIRARKSILSDCIDLLTLALGLYMLVMISGDVFGAIRLFGLNFQNRMSVQTIFCLFLLTIVIFNERTHFGRFSIFISDTIAGKTARLAAPFALSLPFTVEVFRALAIKTKFLRYEYATALATSATAVLAFLLIYIMSRRIEALEGDIRDLSLRDELTSLYNRRGFYLIAAQALSLAQRMKTPYAVIFIDMDNLKQVNDTLGHEVGSELLREMAAILITNVRDTDIVGRVGGDEFVIAGSAGLTDTNSVIYRLQAATTAANLLPDRSYTLQFSYGDATSVLTRRQSLQELLADADTIMYQAKRDITKPPCPLLPPITP